MIKSHIRLQKVILILLDIGVTALAAALAYELRLRGVAGGRPFPLDQNYMLVAVYFIILQTVMFIVLGVYQPQRRLNFWSEVTSLAKGFSFTVLFFLSMLFLAKVLHFSRGFFLLFFALDALFIVVFHYTYRKVLLSVQQRSGRQRRIWLVGHTGAGMEFLKKIGFNPSYGYRVTRIYTDRPSKDYKKYAQQHDIKMQRSSSFFKDLTGEQPDIVIYSHIEEKAQFLGRVLDHCYDHGVQINIIPDLSGLIAHNTFIEVVEGLPLVSVQSVPLRRGYNWLVKRLFDVVFSLSALVLISPLMLIMAIAIRIFDGKPVIFSQQRVGLDNRPFQMHKFRTMEVQEGDSSDTQWTVDHDPRVTGLGRFMKRLNIDELPQFWNVLRGNMSVVGPRPERPFFVKQFRKEIQGYMRRHQVKSGITGLAQVAGLRGDTSIAKRIEVDIYYIENWSLLLDIRIIFLTLIRQLYDRNA